MSKNIPRRIRLDLMTPTERAITDIIRMIEALPPDVRLTQAQNKLAEARELVADFVDQEKK